MKNILIHVKSNEALNNYIFMLENNKYDENIKYSEEVKQMIQEFYNNNWGVYLTTIENYKGIALNNPVSMRKGMTKNYLVEVDSKELEKIGMLTIPTKVYSKKIEYSQIAKEYSNLESYLIKPITGELSNSLKCLKDIDEEFLRYKESKVGGWVIQPIKNEIWNGEYQLVFVGGKLIYGQKKNYPKEQDANIPEQKNRVIEKYDPSESEIRITENVIKYFMKLYNIKIDICRIDFMKDNEGRPILIEFEMVNPGFFIGYMKEDDETIKHIVKEVREYCENYTLCC